MKVIKSWSEINPTEIKHDTMLGYETYKGMRRTMWQQIQGTPAEKFDGYYMTRITGYPLFVGPEDMKDAQK